jgi:hypothetical protein
VFATSLSFAGSDIELISNLFNALSVVRVAHGFDHVDPYGDLPTGEDDDLGLPSRSAI